MSSTDDLNATGEAAGAPLLSPTFHMALVYAAEAHGQHRRKGTEQRRPGHGDAPAGVPYVAHLMEVSALVLDAGGSERDAIAGLLHDVVEDQGGLARAAEVRSCFGDEVADMVLQCSDSTDTASKASDYWFDRKRAHIRHISPSGDGLPEGTLLVLAADKISNARAIIADIVTSPDPAGRADVFRRFRPFADAVGDGKGAQTPPRATDPFFDLTGGVVPASDSDAVRYSASCTLWYYRSVFGALRAEAARSGAAALLRLTQVLDTELCELELLLEPLGVPVGDVAAQVAVEAS
ncbi:MAG: HD domain-containing protein [Actinomycetes bacterium]